MNILFVALGGGIGAVCRYFLGVWLKTNTKERFIPTAMLIVNVLGSFGLGLFLNIVYGAIPLLVDAELPFLLIGIGFFGAFTTYSTFSVEAVTLLQKKKWKAFTSYVVLSIGGSIAAFIIAFTII
ncbi:fluoride efflux transporter CrcB [Evansella cellulosilytica]|uniref:Fluoride-specific ion channel FluC n=1 Tax=Evansella cellulosilytica (strain ATCC 21833 / DSM 2522 / FERM P-1141 / JCM 9156 / N-4) TaxID=649639 RepID=E6TV04_EVAC2|nr:fluoride efflux transporter CrcB [Evansella cellulosilytica]ADU28587.1 CrcB protein [Evansella cellulosilytica DSM 2522]